MNVETERLFFALWPDEGLRAQLAHEMRKNVRHCGGRPVQAGNFHITLAFVGSIAKQRRGCLEAAAASVQGVPFDLSLDRVGYWSRPKSYWLGCETVPAALLDLVVQLNRYLSSCGYQPDLRPYTPHITLARKVQQAPKIDQVTPIGWNLDHFHLVRSQTRTEGAQYEVVGQWPLG